MKKLSLACALGAAALGLTAAPASAAGLPASPAPNETVKGPQPTFTWTVPAGETVQSILIAPSRHSDDGVLDRSMDVGEVAAKTRYHYSASILTPGDYYWQLSGLDAEGNPSVSEIRRFVVPPVIKVSAVKPGWAPYFDNGRPVDYFVAAIRCNLDKRPTITLKVYRGAKTIWNDSFSAGWCVDMQPYRFSNTFQKPLAMPKGTRLTMQYFIKTDGYTFESAVTPFRAH